MPVVIETMVCIFPSSFEYLIYILI
jgi:hypothetical protein